MSKNTQLIEANRERLLAWEKEGKSYYWMGKEIGLKDRSRGGGFALVQETTQLQKKGREMKINVLKVNYHRNGISGNGFYVVLFEHEKTVKVGIVFEEQGNVAVLDVELLHEGVIESGENTWRGDEFEPALRAACDAYICELEQRFQ